MKKILRRAAAAVLSLVMTAGLLSGCGSAYDPIQEALGFPGTTVMMTVNGNDVTADDFFFWMCQSADEMAAFFPAMGMEVDWTFSMDGTQDMDTYVKESAKSMAVLYSVTSAQAEAGGYTFTKEDEAAYEEELATAMEQLGGEDAYNEWLQTMLLTPKTMQDLSSVGVLYEHMMEGMYREGGEYAPAEGELASWAQEQDLLYAKHILLMTTDMATGEPLSEADIAAKKATADDILAQLQAITDPAQLEAKFDELMNEYSEDTGLAAYPDGYLFTAGDMVAEFENATRSLAFGQVSGIVESSYGYHIILRMDPASSGEIQSQWEQAKMGELLDQWVAEAEVVTTEQFDTLTTVDFYEKLTAYRETLNPEETAEDAVTSEEEGAGETGEAEGAEDAEGTGDAEDAGTEGEGEEAAE